MKDKRTDKRFCEFRAQSCFQLLWEIIQICGRSTLRFIVGQVLKLFFAMTFSAQAEARRGNR